MIEFVSVISGSRNRARSHDGENSTALRSMRAGNANGTTTNMKITKDERDLMGHIERVALKPIHFRSKMNLRVLSNLQKKGLITFDPFEPCASLTDLGRAVLKHSRLNNAEV